MFVLEFEKTSGQENKSSSSKKNEKSENHPSNNKKFDLKHALGNILFSEATSPETEDETSRCVPTLSSKSILVTCFIIFTTWIFASSAFYYLHVGLTFTQALFFAVETGLSVGYGANGIDCGGDAACETLTSFHIMFVAFLFAISLAAYASLILVEKSKRLHEEERSKVIQDENQDRLKSIRGEKDETTRCCSSRVTSSSTSSVIRYVLLYVVYVMLGIVYGVEIESWTFTKSLLFSTSAVATGGVVAPDRVDDVSMLLVTLYTIFGAFVFAFLITNVVDYVMEYMARRRIRSDGALVLTPKDRKNLREDLFSGRSHVSYDTFLEYTLLKTRAVSADALRRVRLAWSSINVDGDNRITVEEMYASQLFEIADTNDDGDLSRAEFSKLCELIVRRQGYDAYVQSEISRRLQREFMRIDSNCSGRIEKHEFVRFVIRLEMLLSDFVNSSGGGISSSSSSSKVDDGDNNDLQGDHSRRGRRSRREERVPFSIVSSSSSSRLDTSSRNRMAMMMRV